MIQKVHCPNEHRPGKIPGLKSQKEQLFNLMPNFSPISNPDYTGAISVFPHGTTYTIG
jgi:hypothetical protein